MNFSILPIVLALSFASTSLAADHVAPTQAAVARDVNAVSPQARDTTNIGVGVGVTDATIVINGSSYTGSSSTSSSSSSSSSSPASSTAPASSSSPSSKPDGAASLSLDKQSLLCIVGGAIAAVMAL